MSFDADALEMLFGAEEEDLELSGIICRSTCDGTWSSRG